MGFWVLVIFSITKSVNMSSSKEKRTPLPAQRKMRSDLDVASLHFRPVVLAMVDHSCLPRSKYRPGTLVQHHFMPHELVASLENSINQ